MKIFNNGNISKIQNAYKNNRANNNKQELNVEKSDKLSISEDAKLIQKAIKLAKDSPDIREEKVNEIKNKMKNGTYNIDSKHIAKKILEDIKSREDI